jgi:hypothetical protein
VIRKSKNKYKIKIFNIRAGTKKGTETNLDTALAIIRNI